MLGPWAFNDLQCQLSADASERAEREALQCGPAVIGIRGFSAKGFVKNTHDEVAPVLFIPFRLELLHCCDQLIQHKQLQ
jgi:hypothetical protein